jgi:hypothetical protein
MGCREKIAADAEIAAETLPRTQLKVKASGIGC